MLFFNWVNVKRNIYDIVLAIIVIAFILGIATIVYFLLPMSD